MPNDQAETVEDTAGKAIDDLTRAVVAVNAASKRVRASGLSVQISVNGYDYGDTLSLRLEGEPLAAMIQAALTEGPQ